jgi:hypothetical protein
MAVVVCYIGYEMGIYYWPIQLYHIVWFDAAPYGKVSILDSIAWCKSCFAYSKGISMFSWDCIVVAEG